MGAVDVAVVAVVVVGYALISGRSRRWPVTMPMVLVGAGVATHLLGIVRLDLSISGIGIIGEAALAVVLFSDAVRIDVSALRRERGLPVRLLAIGLPLSVLLGTVVVAALLPGLGIAAAALLAAILAPTDPALGQAVIDDTSVPARVRQSLNVESGLNDGLVLPVVVFFVALAGGRSGSEHSWPVFVLQQIGLGVGVGVAVGAVGALALRRALVSGWVDGLYAQLSTLGAAVLALTVALALGGNGFVAAFTGGLAFGALSADRGDHLIEYTEDSGQLLAAISFFLFGNVLLPTGLQSPTWPVVACAVLTLTVGRLVPVGLALLGSGTAPRTRLFIGWFGPRGLASIVFGLLLLEDEVPGAEQLFSVIAYTVLFSVVAHGATAGWGARRFGAWYEASGRGRPQVPMAEAEPCSEHRTRGWRD